MSEFWWGVLALLKLGSAALVLIWGKPDRGTSNKINAALTNAMTEVSKKQEAEGGT